MAKVMVFQHVPYEPLGSVYELLRKHNHRIRYINFDRHPDAVPNIQNYNALIILGGPMCVDETTLYPFLNTEINTIREALKMNIPILGICLGCQLLAKALGSKTTKLSEQEIGWYPLRMTDAAHNDPLFKHWENEENIFQWHGDNFELPENTVHLITGTSCQNQAFRFGDKAYGLQFHLEATEPLIKRWAYLPQHQKDLDPNDIEGHRNRIMEDTHKYLQRTEKLSLATFNAFLDLLPSVKQHIHLPSR